MEVKWVHKDSIFESYTKSYVRSAFWGQVKQVQKFPVVLVQCACRDKYVWYQSIVSLTISSVATQEVDKASLKVCNFFSLCK